MSIKSFIAVCCFIIGSLLLCANVSAQQIDPNTYADNLTKKVSPHLSPLTAEMFGEVIDLSTGTLSFNVVDVSIEGNSDLLVQFGRKTGSNTGEPIDYAMGMWNQDVPSLTGVAYCNMVIPNPDDVYATAAEGWYEKGLQLRAPGQGKRLSGWEA